MLDVNLGHETSMPIAERLIAQNTPFVVMSGYSREQQMPVFKAAPLLTKPVRIDRLVEALNRCLAHSA